MSRVSDKVVVITGAASGIGRATVELFGREGARVVALDVAPSYPPFEVGGVLSINLDISDERGWTRAVEQVLTIHGRIDILVNNAGVAGSQKPVVDETLVEWNALMSINMTGVFLGMRAVLPSMIARRAGSIVNISSAWANVATPGAVAYQSSKGAVRHLTKNAAVTYAADGVRVNSVHPGMIETPAVAGAHSTDGWVAAAVSRTPLERMGQPAEIAEGILFLASDASSYVTGAELVMDGGFTAV